MSVIVEHVYIKADDLTRVTADYRALGFTVTPGGARRIPGGSVRNAMAYFADGTFLEIFAASPSPLLSTLRALAQPWLVARLGRTRRFESLARMMAILRRPEGLTGYVLLSTAFQSDFAAARDRGFDWGKPVTMGRTRPDGRTVRWTIAAPSGPEVGALRSPYTPEIPHDPAEVHHANGVTGLAEVTLVVRDLAASAERLERALGVPPAAGEDAGRPSVVFAPGGAALRLTAPQDGPARAWLERYGDGVYALTLRSSTATAPARLDPCRAHGAAITVIPASDAEVVAVNRPQEAP
jgi:catechol 2,3-dioxygenase-like lactoylglutathione lyase family enzyme